MEEGLKFVRRNLVISSVAITLAVIFMFYTLSAFSKGFGQHVAHSTVPIETTQIRFILWDLALKFFFQNPVIGIGLGQFSKLSTIGLEPKYQIFYLVIVNIGTHNLLLSYLSETGIIGAICFLFFLYSSLRLAWLKFKLSTTTADLKLSGALLGGLFYIVITSLYAGQWTTNILGMMFALILAWTVILKPNSLT
jgi:O-antigen ligase